MWAAVRPGAAIPQAKVPGEGDKTRASLVQVTNLGISVKDSPQNTLIFVTRLDTGAPVAGASVSIVRLDNRVFWRGTTGANGIAMAPDTALRDEHWWKFAFIVTAEKDGDAAYVGSDWNEGVSPWDFGLRFNLQEASPLLRGTVFTDRGVYRLGEEVHFKAVLRENSAAGVRLLPAGTPVLLSVRDSQDRVVDDRTVKLNAWSSAEWTMTLPQEGSLGNYSVRAILERDKPKPKKPEALRPGDEPGPDNDEFVDYIKRVDASFLVAAYRRPDFRVDVALTGTPALAGSPLNGVVNARYLFGAPMGARPVSWSLSRSRLYGVPAPIKEKFPEDRWEFVGYPYDEDGPASEPVQSQETTLTKAGTLPLKLVTEKSDGKPWQYTLEGDVEDVSRQHIANRTAMTVHPAPWYVGVKRLPYFAEQKNGLKTEIVAVGLDGVPVAGVPVELKLTQIQWQSVRRSEGGGFYTWDTKRVEIPIGAWTVTTGAAPIPFDATLPNGGNFVLTATGRGNGELFAVTHDVLLCARRRLHRMGALRSQSHRARPRAQDVEAGRHRANHDPVAVGAGHGAADDRARGHPHLPAIRADLHAGVRHRADHGSRHPERVRLRPAREGTEQSGGRRRRGAIARHDRGSRFVGSGQAGVPPRLRRAESGRRDQAVDGRGQGQQGRVSSRERREGGPRREGSRGTRRLERGHACGPSITACCR